MATRRRVLLLQGPSSLFFCRLGIALRAEGADVIRVGFAPGDRLYWARRAGRLVICKESRDRYGSWLRTLLEQEGITDIVMLGGGRFYHKQAISVARELSAPPRMHIIEHGLIRPGWIFVETGGLERDAANFDGFMGTTECWEPPSSSARSGGFLLYASMDVGYHLANVSTGWCYNRNYVHHAVDGPIREYSGWLRKLMRRPFTSRHDAHALARVDAIASSEPMFLFPLQLETDFQIRDRGKGVTLREHLVATLASFASHAPENTHLIMKRHPLDNGWTDWRSLVDGISSRFGVKDRVLFSARGDIASLLSKTTGVVTVNSTVGFEAVCADVPCKALGEAIYDLPGITANQPLDRFWSEPERPCADIVQRFRSYALSNFHVPGAFDGPGAVVGATALAARVCR